MSDLYKNKFRISPARLKNWNYAKEAMYFVTICTKNMECLFGEINDSYSLSVETPNIDSLQKEQIKFLKPSEIGKIAIKEWYKTIELRPDMNILLDEFVVMPNHLHGIICIGKNEFNSGTNCRDAMHGVL